MKKLFIGLVLSFGLLNPSLAQSQMPEGPYTLQQCVEIALANNLTLRRTELNQLATEANLLEAQGQRIPSFSVGGSSSYRWGRSLNPVTNDYETNELVTFNPFADARIGIFNGMRVNNSINQARKDLEAGQFDIEASRNQISLDVINQFINVVFNREQVKIAENQLNTSKEQLERTKKLVSAGTLAIAEQLDIQSTTATNEVELINAKNNLKLAKLTLAQAMQIPFTDDFEVLEPAFDIDGTLMVGESASNIYQIAVETMPEIKSAEAKLESADHGIKIAKSGYYPSLQLSGNVFSNFADQPKNTNANFDPFGDQIKNNLSQSLGLSLSIPIFSNFSNKASVQRARVQYQLSEVAQQEAKNQLRQDIETAYNQAQAAEQSYQASVTRVKSLEETFRIAQQRFDLGAINSVDFQVAQNNLFNAQADLLNAKYTYIFRIKVLDFYLGNPINLN